MVAQLSMVRDMVKNFNWTIFLLLLCCIVSCNNGQRSNDVPPSNKVDDSTKRCFQIKSYDFLDRDFNKYYDNYLESQDSCFFRAFIRFYRDSIKIKSYRSFKNCFISSVSDNKLNLSFSIVGKTDQENQFFYAHYDIYELIFSTKNKLGSMVPFKNNALNDVMNVLLKIELPEKDFQRRRLFEVYLINLYYTIYDGIDEAPIPIFDRLLSRRQFIEKYKNRDNALMIEEKLPENINNKLIIFEIDYIGAVIFKYDFTPSGTVQIEEFIVPKVDRVKAFRPDVLPDYLDVCR